jgi:hypothetical protein
LYLAIEYFQDTENLGFSKYMDQGCMSFAFFFSQLRTLFYLFIYLFYFIFLFPLFICAYNDWVITLPFPHPMSFAFVVHKLVQQITSD